VSEKKKITTIINPIAGIKGKQKIVVLLEKYLDKYAFDYELHYTEYAGHARKLAKQAVAKRKDAVIVAGGDGTVNEVASALVGSETALGIIPMGSGNGFARQMKIPNHIKNAVNVINRYHCRRIDTFTVNSRFAINLAGVGFDGLVAEKFSQLKTRGFWSYMKSIISQYPGYMPFQFTISSDDLNLNDKALMVCVANSGQFGNNAVIAPLACADDGWLDVCVMRRVPVFLSPVLAVGLLTNSIHRTLFIRYYRVRKLILTTSEPMHWHIDGEPCGMADHFSFQINPLSLQLLV
jgi:YegS/Rv2252/BmrU family lipid kinase